MPEVEHIINVLLSNDKVTVEKKENPLPGRPGEKVTWRFTGNAAGFLVKPRSSDLFDSSPEQSKTNPNEISGTISTKFIGGASSEYDIFKKLEWENGINGGGCIKNPDPP